MKHLLKPGDLIEGHLVVSVNVGDRSYAVTGTYWCEREVRAFVVLAEGTHLSVLPADDNVDVMSRIMAGADVFYEEMLP